MTASTLIPSIGMTFASAAERVRDLIAEHDAITGNSDEANDGRDALHTEWMEIHTTILATEPRTLADAVAMLDRMLCPVSGIEPSAAAPAAPPLHLLRALLVNLLTAAGLADLQPVNDASDPWSASVELFTRAGPKKLDIPQKPNAVMVRAGAAAAGVTEEQFRAGYLAAIAAFQGEGEAA